MEKSNDLTGQRFGKLVVVGLGDDYVSPKGRRKHRWLCKCDCGGSTLVQPQSLLLGRTQSCGCLQKELARKRAVEHPTRGIDIAGKRFGRLTAIRPDHREDNEGWLWICKCDCGNEVLLPVKRLNSGKTQSCGCLRDDKISHVNVKHGKSHKSRLYNVWVGMRQRCADQNHKSYKNYGGRGIRVCEQWDDFTAFELWALENGYDPKAKYGDCTLDRIDVNGNYEPANCRWVDSSTQAKNKRAR